MAPIGAFFPAPASLPPRVSKPTILNPFPVQTVIRLPLLFCRPSLSGDRLRLLAAFGWCLPRPQLPVGGGCRVQRGWRPHRRTGGFKHVRGELVWVIHKQCFHSDDLFPTRVFPNSASHLQLRYPPPSMTGPSTWLLSPPPISFSRLQKFTSSTSNPAPMSLVAFSSI